jgi:hypothetical protein
MALFSIRGVARQKEELSRFGMENHGFFIREDYIYPGF